MSDSSTEGRLDRLEAAVSTLDRKVEVLALEVRAGFAEGRATQAEFKTDLFARLDTLVGAIGDLRGEYTNHIHPDPNA